MFIDVTLKKNNKLIETAVKLHRAGLIQPDTYVVDLDAVIDNAILMKDRAEKHAIELFFMTKQFGRNPLVAQKLQKAGLTGAVAVDYCEAQLLAANGVKIAHAGHLVQLPSVIMPKLLAMKPEFVTVFSVEKAREIDYCAKSLGMKQKTLLRVISKDDVLYPGQYGGVLIDELDRVKEFKKLKYIELCGVTSFPCFLYDEKQQSIEPTHNLTTLIKAKHLLNDFGFNTNIINAPSANCAALLPKMALSDVNQAEPGHGLTGTTPLHANGLQPEIPAIVYVSEISHTGKKASFCFGGGYYRRSHARHALVFDNNKFTVMNVVKPLSDSIDYYIELAGKGAIGQTVVMAFRTQIFVTRSQVAVVSGIQKGMPRIEGLYTSLGGKV